MRSFPAKHPTEGYSPKDQMPDKQSSTRVAFKAVDMAFSPYIHKQLTHQSLTAINHQFTPPESPGKTEVLSFTPGALNAIEAAVTTVDMKSNAQETVFAPFALCTILRPVPTAALGCAVGILIVEITYVYNASRPVIFSDLFFEPPFHFDNEEFEDGSKLLKNLKNRVVIEMQFASQSSSETEYILYSLEARKDFGTALHTLQDFYSHSNWVELGHTEPNDINFQLGREIITRYASKSTPVTPEGDCPTFVGSEEDIGDCTTLLPEFQRVPGRDPKDELLTSAYFDLELKCLPAEEGEIRKRKIRHGILGCGDGLDKDEPGRPNYEAASKLAMAATVNYTLDILNDPRVKNDRRALMALMGGQPESISIEPGEIAMGGSAGDPHLRTMDGLRYDFQQVGEYLLIGSSDGQTVVQARFSAERNHPVTVATAVAVKADTERIAFYTQHAPIPGLEGVPWIDGKPIRVDSTLTLKDGTVIARDNTNAWLIRTSKGESISLRLYPQAGFPFLDVTVRIKLSEPGRYEGLLGNFNGYREDDLVLRNRARATVPSAMTYFEQKRRMSKEAFRSTLLHNRFGGSWRITQGESLFDYPKGMDTKRFTDMGFPREPVSISSLPIERVQRAKEACTEMEVEEEQLNDCIHDVAVTDEVIYAEATRRSFEALPIQAAIDRVDRFIPKRFAKFAIRSAGTLHVVRERARIIREAQEAKEGGVKRSAPGANRSSSNPALKTDQKRVEGAGKSQGSKKGSKKDSSKKPTKAKPSGEKKPSKKD